MKKTTYIENQELWKKDFSFYIPIKVRFSETDMFGHVNNVSAFIYFEEARIEYLKAHDLFGDFNEEGIPVVSDLQCDYHRQIFLQNKLKLYVKTDTVGKTSFDLHYMAVNEKDEICLTGRGRLVNVHVKNGKPLELSEKVKEKLLR